MVWQDGSIEENISSRELYPIHALDDQEFFPGDFVVRGTLNTNLDSYDPHSYGVIQNVDHSGRTSAVKWFRTYTTGNGKKIFEKFGVLKLFCWSRFSLSIYL